MRADVTGLDELCPDIQTPRAHTHSLEGEGDRVGGEALKSAWVCISV